MSGTADDIIPISPDEVDRRPSTNFRRRSSIFGTIQIHKRRWWILFVFGGLGFMQCTVWNTWGPITGSAKAAYDWSDATIALLSMWGTITLMVGLVPFTILLQRKGLRISMIITSFMMAVGTALRCVTLDPDIFTYLAHTAALLNGFAGIIIQIAPSLMSSTWFPIYERTTATGVGCTFNQLGNAGGFFLGPLLVNDPVNSSSGIVTTGTDEEEMKDLRISIRNYMCIIAGICTAFFIFALAYFPDKAPHPPSLSCALQEKDRPVKEDIKLVLTNGNFWLLLIPYALTLGVNVAWGSVLDINLMPYGINQHEAGYIGLYSTFGGVFMALVSTKLTETMLQGHIKFTIMGLMLIATAAYTWFLLLINGVLVFSKTQVYISSVLGASFNYAVSPLFFELAVELVYPVQQGVVGGVLTMCHNSISAAFLLVMQFGIKSVLWMDYLLAGQGAVVVLFMCILKAKYNRSSMDLQYNKEKENREKDKLSDTSNTNYGSIEP